ncbi:hypothetical protein JZ751_023785, partial [Albula glossodonta]
GWQDRIGTLQDKVLEVPEGTEVPYPIFQIEAFAGDETVDGPYSVTINVRDINNHPPIFAQTEYHGEVMEHTPAGEPFIRVFATDQDNPDTPNARLSYSIVNQIPDRLKKPLFQINSMTGEISVTPEGEEHLRAREAIQYGKQEDPQGGMERLKSKFDEYCTPNQDIPYELNPFYTCVERSETMRMNPADDPDYILIVRAQDLEGASENALSANAKVSITVRQNLWKAPGPLRIRENLEMEYPHKIAEVQSNDLEAIYKISQKERFPTFPFMINEKGEIFVTGPLDREEKSMYILVVFAQNGDGVDLDKPMEIPVIVEDVNDNPPVCVESESVFEVQENEQMGSQVGVLGVHDIDEENSLNSLLSYQLLSHQPDISGHMFTVEPISGRIQVAKTPLKRKEVPEFHLTVKVSDKGGDGTGFSTECKIVIKVIDINNEIPVFEKNDYGTIEIAEDAPPGTTLLTVLATDADDPGTGSSKVEYHIKAGDQDGVFAIDAEGNIYVAKRHDSYAPSGFVFFTKPLDFESNTAYSLQIDATNPEPLVPGVEYDSSSTTFVDIKVSDVDEVPEFNMDIIEVNVQENATVGATIVTLDASDPEGAKISYKLEGDEKSWLEIDADTGEIKTKAKLDHEEVAVYNIKVTAYEKESPEKVVEKDITIRILDVNDNIPKLIEYQGYMCVKKPEPIIVHAEDKDGPPFGKPLTFILSQPKKFPNWEIQAVDDTSAKLILKKMPDEDRIYTLPINVKDSMGVGVSQKFEVHVCNCTELGYCYTAPEAHPWKFGVSTTVGIFAGTLGFA